MDRALKLIIGDLYAGILDDAAWDCTMVGVRKLAGAHAQSLVFMNPSTSEVCRERLDNFDPALSHDYFHNLNTCFS